MEAKIISRVKSRALVVLAVLALALVAIVVALVATNDRGPSRGPSVSPSISGPVASTSKSAAPSTSIPSAPVLPDAARRSTPDGAVAFFRYFWDSFNYSYDSLDSSELRRLSAESCASCASYIDAIDTAKRQNETFSGGRISVLAAVSAPNQDLEKVIVDAVLSQAPAFTISETGATLTSAPGTQRLVLKAAVQWQGDEWVLLGMDS